MGSLRLLRSHETNVHMLLTSSNLAEIYVYDELKSLCGATIDSVLEVSNRSTFNNMLELVNMQPLLSEKWLFIINYKSGIKQLVKKYEGIFQANTAIFLVKVDNYKDFKEFKGIVSSVNDMYLNVIRHGDVSYLLNGYKLSQTIIEFIEKSYYRDPEKVFVLMHELDSGAVVSSNRDVVKICGESSGSIARFAMLLLNEMPFSQSGLKRVYSKRVKLLVDLCDSFGTRSTYNFLVATVKDILNIKILYLQGIIYDTIRDLPEAYDEKKLARYNMYLKRIIQDLTYEGILRLYIELSSCKSWRAPQDGVLFLYDYYLKNCKID